MLEPGAEPINRDDRETFWRISVGKTQWSLARARGEKWARGALGTWLWAGCRFHLTPGTFHIVLAGRDRGYVLHRMVRCRASSALLNARARRFEFSVLSEYESNSPDTAVA
jgi:hypothetical protein